MGWIGGATPVDITIRLTPVVAAAIAARTWQPGQRMLQLPDGGMEVTFTVDELGEPVRWALGFGSEAVVIAPPEAVAFARQMVGRIAQNYAVEGSLEHREMAAG